MFRSGTAERVGARRRAAGLSLAAALCAGVAAMGAWSAPGVAQAQGWRASDGSASELVVASGKSRVIELPDRYVDVMIADPKVADVLPLNTHSIYVVGKAPGSTALTIYGPGKRMLAAVNVVVSGDIEGLKRRIHDVLPEERRVEVRPSGEAILLSGTVSSPAALNQILTLAETYAPRRVVNMMAVEGTQQVMLTVRFVEMQRSAAKDLHVNTQWMNHNGNFAFQTGDSISKSLGSGTTINSTTTDAFGAVAALFHMSTGDLSVLFDALEQNGVVKTLAEPTLVAMSGDTASFLAGGEFPIPIAQASAAGQGGFPTITVEFKQFGVSLAFTPTILKDGMVNLVVNPEVSAIDPANSVTSGSVRIPGLTVRRAHTTIELRDGESFTIAGLLSENYSNNVRQMPWIGDVPILGTLFRSTSFQRGDSELVIVVTPHLVTPRRGPTALPGDHFVPPSDFELFLLGRQSGDVANLRPEDRALISLDPNRGGVDGPHGHVLY